MLVPGTILQNRYLIVRLIAEGGMGAVYLAQDQRLDSEVALKETRFTDERMSKAFEREARLLARLRHPALPRVSDHFLEENGQFLIMEYIPGEDLAEALKVRGAPFCSDDVVRWADQLLDVLEYLHSQEPPVVHRDIKPQNLKLTQRGQIVLLDFGLAKGLPLQMTRVTSSGSIFGYTPSYAPMEQIQGVGTDPRSDLYSLAATIYHFVTGNTPIDALSRAAAIVEGQSDPLPTANEINSECSRAIAREIHKGLALSRNQRHASATEMRIAMRVAYDAIVPTQPDDETVIIGTPQRFSLSTNHETDVSDTVVPDVVISNDRAANRQQRNEAVPRQEVAERVEDLVSAGASALEAGEYEVAVQNWEAVRDIDPAVPGLQESIEAAERNAKIEELVSAGASAFDSGNYERATQDWEAAKELDPALPGVRESIAATEQKARIEELISAGASAFDAGQYEAAAQNWEAARKLDSAVPGIKESIDAAQRQIRKEQGRKLRVERLVAEGTEAFDAKQYGPAIDRWSEALILSPNEAGVEAGLKAARTAADKEAQRQAKVKQLVSAGTEAFDAGRFELALTHWNEALSLSPNELGVKKSIEAASQKKNEMGRRTQSKNTGEAAPATETTANRLGMPVSSIATPTQGEKALFLVLAVLMVLASLIIILAVDSSVRFQATIVLTPIVILLGGALVWASIASHRR